MRYLSLCLLLTLPRLLFAGITPLEDEENRALETQKILERSLQIANFYELPEGDDLKEITDDLLESLLVSDTSKDAIRALPGVKISRS